MYSNVEYASWLNATYGLSESMRELVPSRNVPPLFVAEPVAVAAKIETAVAIAAAGIAAAHRLVIVPSSSGSERGLVHRQRPRIGVERTTDPERNGSEVLAVAERELVEDGHSEVREMLVEDVLDRFPGAPVGDVAREITVVATVHVADDDAEHAVELARMAELRQLAVDVVRRGERVLEEEDRAVRLELPRCAQGLHEQPQAPAHERARRPSGRDRPHVRVVGVWGHLADGVAAQHLQQPLAAERRGVLLADADKAVAVERREPGALADRHVQRGDVAVADERLRTLGEQLEVEVGEQLARAEAALQRLHDVDVGVGEERMQVLRALPRVAGDVVVARMHTRRELHAVAL